MTALKQLQDQKSIIAGLKAKVKSLEDKVKDINTAAKRVLKRWKLHHEEEKEALRQQMTHSFRQMLQTMKAQTKEVLKKYRHQLEEDVKRRIAEKARMEELLEQSIEQNKAMQAHAKDLAELSKNQAALIRTYEKNREAQPSGNARTWRWPWASGRSENSHHSPSSPEIIF